MKPYKKTIMSLANSRRPGGTCFAGREFASGKSYGWIRPINSAHNGAISDQDRLYKDGSHADILDIVSIALLEPKPNQHHQEDHQIKSDEYWQKIGRATWQDVVKATDTVNGALWVNEDSSYHGRNDKVSATTASTLTRSLYLIKPTTLNLIVAPESLFQGGSIRRVRADFTYNNISYNFVVTDEPTETAYMSKDDGKYNIEDARLCVSLAEASHGIATKLVAAVITSDRV